MFRVGDLVKVKEDAATIPDGINYVPEMYGYRGNIYEVKQIKVGGNKRAYNLYGCDCGYHDWVFDESWLEPVDNRTYDISENEIKDLLCLK